MMQLEIIHSEPTGSTPARKSQSRPAGNSRPPRPKAGASSLDSARRGEMRLDTPWFPQKARRQEMLWPDIFT